jgi:hypothetical protein
VEAPTFTYLFFAGLKIRLPGNLFPARRRCDHLGFFLLWLLDFAIAALLSLGHAVHLLLGFEFVQFIRLQSAPARRADTDIHVAIAQQLSRGAQCHGRAAAAEIGAAILVGPRDQSTRAALAIEDGRSTHQKEKKEWNDHRRDDPFRGAKTRHRALLQLCRQERT